MRVPGFMVTIFRQVLSVASRASYPSGVLVLLSHNMAATRVIFLPIFVLLRLCRMARMVRPNGRGGDVFGA
jgi:hypothetical protein